MGIAHVHDSPGEIAHGVDSQGWALPPTTTEAAGIDLAGYGVPNHGGSYLARKRVQPEQAGRILECV